MAPLPIKLNPKALTLAHSLRPLSSSPHLPDPTSSADNNQQPPSPPPPPPQSSYASLFSDIKDRLKSPPSPPRRIPTDPPPPQFSNPVPSQPATSLDDVRKHLAEFRLRRDPNINPNPSFGPSPDRPASFQELFKNSALRNDANLKPEGGGRSGQLSFESIRESLRQFQSGPKDPINFRSQFTFRPSAPDQTPLVGDQEKPQESIFGKEMREKLGEKEGEEETKALKTEFVKMYSYDELGEKLRKLRPEGAAKGGKDWFSLSELNVRLAKLRELEEKETESKMGGVSFRDLRESLLRLKEADSNKKANMQKLSSLVNIGLPMMPSFLLKPPQEQLLEKYFHPDHMSSAEKMKLELKKVRDEFKMSESDCGSSRVQIAQLTTKIKHLSSALHKKDKHSRKGLHDMVQRRKKLLKYLRRTDWDSYCFVLSKLGLRDIPEYKTPDYKT